MKFRFYKNVVAPTPWWGWVAFGIGGTLAAGTAVGVALILERGFKKNKNEDVEASISLKKALEAFEAGRFKGGR